jgi:very-short-patch-repair endonuclease/predicted transcriptional regulator of viral defense system
VAGSPTVATREEPLHERPTPEAAEVRAGYRGKPLHLQAVAHDAEEIHVDRLIAHVAEGQRGLVTRRQLRELGLGRGAIDRRIARGALHPLHRGVYLVGHAVPPPLARELAAVLACGPGALLSHRSAARLWGIYDFARDDVEVTVPARGRNQRPGIRVHCVSFVPPQEARVYLGIPATSPARTLLDLAASVPRRDLERAVEEAAIRRLTSREELAAVLERSHRRPGAATLRSVLALGARPGLTRSEAERRLLELLRAGDLPPTDTNVRVDGYEVDFLWRAERLIVEVDGYAFHSSRAAFERDRRRDAALDAAGYAVVRVTWRQIVVEPEAVLVRLARSLASAAARVRAAGDLPAQP